MGLFTKSATAKLAHAVMLLLVCTALPVRAGGEPTFVEVAGNAGIDFVHQSGKTGELWTLEITGAGVGLLDFDGDGLLDIWLVQGGPIVNRAAGMPRDRLFRNISTEGRLRFEDVTVMSGVNATGYGMGIAVGDVDNDGDADVFLANYGANQLFENMGHGRFRDITADAGLAGAEWSISASFADIDGDGLLDLYVGNYLDFTVEGYKPCLRWSSRRSYCAPSNFAAVADRLYQNLGGGKFKDISSASGIVGEAGAMAVVADDFDGDGRTDFYVANDGVDNVLWLNKGGRHFENDALMAGIAVNADGIAEASMGIAVSDFDQDGDPDIFVTHDVKESNTLYRNAGGGWFEDRSATTGVASPSLPNSGFGVGWIDVDNDGDLDLFSANGAVALIEAQLAAGIEPALRQSNQLLLNDGAGRYTPVVNGTVLARADVSRGAAFGDLDNDGDMDVVVTNNHGPARLYRNDTASSNWLGLELRGGDTAPHAIGSLVWREAERIERRRVHRDGSYASAHDPRIVYGMGKEAGVQFVRVRWQDMTEERFGPLKANSYHLLRQGEGKHQ